MKNIFLIIVMILSTTLLVKADIFPDGTSSATYVDNGTGLDVTIDIGWGTFTGEWADGFVVTIDGVDYCIEGANSGAWGDPNCSFFGNGPTGFGEFTTPPTTVTITIPYPAGWSSGDPIDVLIDGYGDAFGDDPTGANSFYLDELVVAIEFVPPPPPVVVDCGGVDADEPFNSGEDPGGNGVVSSTFDELLAPLGAICADDFVVGAAGLELDGILAYGFWSGGIASTVTDITVTIYADAPGGPGAVVCSYTEVPSYIGGAFLGDYGVDFSSTCSLPAGTYWVSVEVNGDNRWNWLQSAGQQGAEAQLIDPIDYFGLGATNWTTFTSIGLGGDMGFGLYSCPTDVCASPVNNNDILGIFKVCKGNSLYVMNPGADTSVNNPTPYNDGVFDPDVTFNWYLVNADGSVTLVATIIGNPYFSPLIPGVYTVEVTDLTNCILYNSPVPASPSYNVDNVVDCNDCGE